MANVDLINKAIQRGFPVGTTDFNRFISSGGRESGFPLVRSSGQGAGKTFIGGSPIDPSGTDRFGRPLPSAKAQQALLAEANRDTEFEPELLEVTKSEPIQAAVSEALERSRGDSEARRAAFQDFVGTAQRFREQSEAEIERDAAETFNTDRLRDFLSRENQRFEEGSQALANRATQFLRRRLDEQQLSAGGAGAPIADSSDLRNRTMQAFLDINLPLQQQLSDRRIGQEQYLNSLGISLAGRSQAARAALLNQLAMPLQLGGQLEGQDLLNLARLQAIEDANKFRGVQGDVPLDFSGLQSFPLGGVGAVPGRIGSSMPRFSVSAPTPSQVVPRSTLAPSGRLTGFRPTLGPLTESDSALTGAFSSTGGIPIRADLLPGVTRRIATPAEARRSRRADRIIAPSRGGDVVGQIGDTAIIDTGSGLMSIPAGDL